MSTVYRTEFGESSIFDEKLAEAVEKMHSVSRKVILARYFYESVGSPEYDYINIWVSSKLQLVEDYSGWIAVKTRLYYQMMNELPAVRDTKNYEFQVSKLK